MMESSGWDSQAPAVAEDDFQFLDMSNISGMGDALNFDFQDFGATTRESMDTPMTGTDASARMVMPTTMAPMASGVAHPSLAAHIMPTQQRPAGDAISDLDAQINFLQHQKLQEQQRQLEERQRLFQEQQAAYFAQQQQQQQQQQNQQIRQHQQRHHVVPPTPQSLEMHPSNHFYPQHEPGSASGMFESYTYNHKDQDMAFTPLVSPAVTPLDAHFAVDTGFTVPGAYFSPLTSPALHAQNDSLAGYDIGQASRSTASPIDLDKGSPSAPIPAVDLSKKVRKNNVSKARKPNVRQSPLAKPQRRKTLSTPNMKAQILSELAEATVERVEEPPQQTLAPPPPASTDGSENASVSPETLSEMPPPPLPQPRSARQSPYMQAQNGSQGVPLPQNTANPHGKPSPATPASLFRISPGSKPSDATGPEQIASDHIESFALPEPLSTSRPDLTPIVTQQANVVAHDTERAKPSLQSLPSPIITRQPQSANSSESPMLTPKAPTPNIRKTPMMAPRVNKKGRSGSIQMSPALLPRISPNIKPLLPGTPGMSAEDTASLLLASKSNYQNILEGNKVPGITYPSELSTNLTSKRTSHKIAEQGRRNRINSALQEIATLLPNSVKEGIEVDENSSGTEKKDPKGANTTANAAANANTPNSKASTVELAIIYIKQLQREVAEANLRAEEAEKKLGEKMTA